MVAELAAARLSAIDTVAVKPAETSLASAPINAIDRLVIDFEGVEHVPSRETLRSLTEACEVVLTIPIRADGFDPLGDNHRYEALPDSIRPAFVAGHPGYLSSRECDRDIAPRLHAALEGEPDAWVGTEGIERLALAIDAIQYELLAKHTAETVRSLRTVGFDTPIAVYAPTLVTDTDGAALDAFGEYVARRRPVAAALPEGARTDRRAQGRAREVLLRAIDDFAIVGDRSTVEARVASLREAGVTTVVHYLPERP